MARLEPVHVMELDRATSKMVCVRINPTRTFSSMGDRGPCSYTWQNGKWFGQGGQEIDAAEIPEEYRNVMKTVPVVIAESGPNVVWTCEFCGETMNRAEKDDHLIAHVRDTLAAAGTPQQVVKSAQPEERPRARPAS